MSLVIVFSSGTMLDAADCFFVSSGTMFNATDCRIVPLNEIKNFSNSEISRFGKESGFNIEKSEELLQSIADALWGDGADTEWSSDTIQAIAEALESQRPDLCAARI